MNREESRKGAVPSPLRPVIFLGFDGVRDVQPQVAEFLAQGLPGDPQQAGGLVLVPTGELKDAGQQEPVHLAVRLRVQVSSIRHEPQVDERFQADVRSGRRRLRLGGGLQTTPQRASTEEFGQESGEQDCTAGLQQGLLEDALQLPELPGQG
jgi:hypothetical protein